MKFALLPLALVIVLVGAADALRRASIVENTLATADEELTTTGAVSRETDAALDDALGVMSSLPYLGPRMTQQVRRTRATQAYWQKEYAALMGEGPLAPGGNETDRALLLLSANAGFRQAVEAGGTPQALARRLDDVLKGYATVLDRDPGNLDAAFNYEFVTRIRAALAGGRAAGMPEPSEERSMQGEQGEPPQGTRKSDFNVIVPLRPEERQEQLDPGSGTQFQRKG